jgi:signal transduction histidine kinase
MSSLALQHRGDGGALLLPWIIAVVIVIIMFMFMLPVPWLLLFMARACLTLCCYICSRHEIPLKVGGHTPCLTCFSWKPMALRILLATP